MTDLDVSLFDVGPVQPKDFFWSKSGKNRKFHDQPFTLFKCREAFLYLL
ncbi:MAG: hypothetical protein ABI995_16855 [Acidobacteriota bacterium]